MCVKNSRGAMETMPDQMYVNVNELSLSDVVRVASRVGGVARGRVGHNQLNYWNRWRQLVATNLPTYNIKTRLLPELENIIIFCDS